MSGMDLNSKTKWLTLNQYRKLYRFLGFRSLSLILMSATGGISIFFLELGFAFILQTFLMAMGLTTAQNIQVPRLLQNMSPNQVILAMLTLGILRALMQSGHVYLQSIAPIEFVYYQRKRLVKWIYQSDSVNTGEVIYFYNHRLGTASSAITSLTTVVFQGCISLLLGVYLLKLSPKLTLLSVITSVIFYPVVRYLNKSIKSLGHKVDSHWQAANSRMLMSIRNLLLVRVHGLQKDEETIALNSLEGFQQNNGAYYKLQAIVTAFPLVLGTVLITGIILSVHRSGEMGPGTLLSYFYLFLRFLQTLSGLAFVFAQLIYYWPQLGAVAKWWADHSLDGIRSKHAGKDTDQSELPYFQLKSPVHWSIRDLSYSYPASDRTLFHDFNLEIAPGKCVVIMGASGSGKTTFLHLLIGELELQKGNIHVGMDQNTMPISQAKRSLLKNLGYVGPESFIFNGTIYDNLVYGLDRKPSSAELELSLAQAECGFVTQMPNALNHRLTDQGQGLSAGQKQRIALARALLRKPKALILDEATANLDPVTEEKLIETFERLKSKMTIVAATHRQALVRIADQVITFDGQSAS